MRKVEGIDQERIAPIQADIDKVLEWRERISSISRFDESVSKKNGYIPISSDHFREFYSSLEDNWVSSYLYTFRKYASPQEIKKYHVSLHDLEARIDKRIHELKIEDPRHPDKSISKHFNQLARDLSFDVRVKFNVERIYEYVANNPEFSELGSAQFTSDIKTALRRAIQEFKIEDRQSLFQAAAKIMDELGYDFNHGQVKNHFAKMVSREEQHQLIGSLPQNYERDGTRSVLGVQSANNIKPVNDTSVAYAEDVARGGQGQNGSLTGSPYADAPKTGRQRFSFRRNFE